MFLDELWLAICNVCSRVSSDKTRLIWQNLLA